MKPLAARLVASMAAALLAPPALADPPVLWAAPGHGWQRQSNQGGQGGQNERRWPSDYGVIGGRCNTQMVGALVGRSAGGAVPPGPSQRRPVAVLTGAMIGGVLGAPLGSQMDAVDRGCIGHTLELAPPNSTVAWTHAGGRIAYTLTPLRHLAMQGQPCREFLGRVTVDGRNQPFRGMACRAGEGVWRLV